MSGRGGTGGEEQVRAGVSGRGGAGGEEQVRAGVSGRGGVVGGALDIQDQACKGEYCYGRAIQCQLFM